MGWRSLQARSCSPPPWQWQQKCIFHSGEHGDDRACGALHPCCAWKDIFDLFCIHWDWWEDTAITDSVRDEEEEVTADDLLCHKHPAREEQVRKSITLQPRAAALALPEPQQRNGKKTRDHWKQDASRKQERPVSRGTQGEEPLALLFGLHFGSDLQLHARHKSHDQPKNPTSQPNPTQALPRWGSTTEQMTPEQSLASPRGLSMPI